MHCLSKGFSVLLPDEKSRSLYCPYTIKHKRIKIIYFMDPFIWCSALLCSKVYFQSAAQVFSSGNPQHVAASLFPGCRRFLLPVEPPWFMQKSSPCSGWSEKRCCLLVTCLAQGWLLEKPNPGKQSCPSSLATQCNCAPSHAPQMWMKTKDVESQIILFFL